MVFMINGVDMLPYIANQGIKLTINDVDGPNAGRSIDGTMIRDRIAQKYRWDVTCRPLTSDELSTILDAISDEWLTVLFTDPVSKTTVTKTMYTNNVPTQYLLNKDGKSYWSGVTFPLIER